MTIKHLSREVNHHPVLAGVVWSHVSVLLACMLLQIAVACCLQGGCIIRAGFLDDIKNAYKRNPDLENLVLDEWFANKLAERQDAWRDVVKIAITNG